MALGSDSVWSVRIWVWGHISIRTKSADDCLDDLWVEFRVFTIQENRKKIGRVREYVDFRAAQEYQRRLGR